MEVPQKADFSFEPKKGYTRLTIKLLIWCMILSAAVVCFPSHVCVAIETRAGNQQWVLTRKLTWCRSSDSFYSAAVIFVPLWPSFVIINTYVNESSGVVDMMAGSNWKVEGNFCSMLSLFRPEWLISLLFAYTHAASSCLQLWSISLVVLITILQSDYLSFLFVVFFFPNAGFHMG